MEGLDGLLKANRLAGRTISSDFRKTLRDLAKPVQEEAQFRALGGIRNMTFTWSRMRIGLTLHGLYVAPKQRGVKGRGDDPRRRRNLARLIQGRSFDPTIEHQRPAIVHGVEDWLQHVGDEWGRVG